MEMLNDYMLETPILIKLLHITIIILIIIASVLAYSHFFGYGIYIPNKGTYFY